MQSIHQIAGIKSKEIVWVDMTDSEWECFAMDNDKAIASNIVRWNKRNNLMQLISNTTILVPTRLPYRRNGDGMQVADDFISLLQSQWKNK